ncbi:MAG: SLC13 family permease [Candidatus Neomarinimicrobiota bacterium]
MTPDVLFFLFLLGLVLVVLAREVFPIDVTALAFMAILLVGGYLDISEAISGFSNKAVLTVAAMFILSQALTKTGFLEVLVAQLERLGGGRKTVGIFIFLMATSLISGFINNTAAVAIFIPLALQLSARFRLSPSKILIPLSYAAICGGTLTLIGTSTNLLVNSMVETHGFPALRMFEFAKMGLIFLLVGTVYSIWVAPRLLKPRAGVSSLTRNYSMSPYLTEFRVAEASPLIGSTCLERGVNENYDITILSIIRDGTRHDTNIRNTKLQYGDILLARGTLNNFVRFREEEKVLLLTDVKMSQSELAGQESVVVEGLVTPGSSLIGKNLKEVDFRNKFGAFVLAIRREGKTLRERIAHIVLHFADTLLIHVARSRLNSLADSRDFAILQEHDIRLHKVRFWWLAIVLIPLIMIVAAAGIVDILQASLIGVVILLILRSITINESYESINWSVIVMMAAFIPAGIAMEKTGTAALMGNAIAGLGQSFPDTLAPYAVLSATYLIAVLLTSIMSNNAAAIVLFPIAVDVAMHLGVDSRPFIFAICFGASTCFMTPLGYQTNLMVYGPGQYRFSDFVRAGAPLNLVLWILASILIPVFWPFH